MNLIGLNLALNLGRVYEHTAIRFTNLTTGAKQPFQLNAVDNSPFAKFVIAEYQKDTLRFFHGCDS